CQPFQIKKVCYKETQYLPQMGIIFNSPYSVRLGMPRRKVREKWAVAEQSAV
ncbi:hypothetical protein ACJX0J_013369, partial [Zea mays]